MQKNNSAQVGQNFQNQLPDNLSGRKTQPPTKLVRSGILTSNQPGRKSVFYSRQLVGKLILEILSNLGRIIFLQFFLEILLKMPFSSATTGRDFSEITPQTANPIGYHLEDK